MALYAFDGTWNKPDDTPNDGHDTNTNVYRFAQAYARCHNDDGQTLQHWYRPGVGTRFGKVGRIIGGFTGAGGRQRVSEMLELCQAEFEAGDRTVDIVGFSRGAALALHFANKLTDGVKVNKQLLKADSIRFLGLWDTVPSFGIPGAILDWANDINIGWELDLPHHVSYCAHALARHERRQAFNVHRLDPKHRNENVHEVWFRGSHADIGGGNENHKRNAITLLWMMEQARKAGIPFTDTQIEVVRQQQDLEAEINTNDMVGEKIDRPFYEGDRMHPSAARRLAVGESKELSIDSRQLFDFSGLMMEKDDQYLFRPDASSRWSDSGIECDPSGWPEDLSQSNSLFSRLRERFLESKTIGLLRRVRSANWFEICACPGFDDREAFPVGKNQHTTTPWVCPQDGPLTFFANDSDFPNQYGNNEGSIRIQVKRVA